MQYKTIVLEMLQQRTELHEQLRKERKLLITLESYSKELKASHEAWKEQLAQARPGSDALQISSEALELALKELEDRLPNKSPTAEEEPLSLDAAMAFIRKASPKK
jgi:chromosome segregation ATPase